MNKQKIRKHIEAKINDLEESIKRHKRSLKPVSPDNAIGRLSRMDAIQLQTVSRLLLKIPQKSLLF